MDEKSFVLLAISKFEKTAFQVIEEMAQHFKLDLSSVNPFSTIVTRQNNLWSGKFNNWSYRFHGDACQFIHEKTNQLLDIKINRGNNFGVINGFYLFRFIETTDELWKLNAEIKESRVHEILQELKKDGTIINIGDECFPAWILPKVTPE